MMTLPRTRISLLALICVAGIVGMLVTDGVGDWLFLALAALPLLLGAGMIFWRSRQQPVAKPVTKPEEHGA